jgi:hypothetical protein
MPVRPFSRCSTQGPGLAVMALVFALGLSACGKEDAGGPGNTPGSTGSGSAPAAATGAEGSRTPLAGDSPAGGSSGFKGGVPAPDASGAPSTGGTTAPGSNTSGQSQNSAANPTAGASAASGTTTNGGLPASQLGSMPTSSGSKNSSPNNSTGNASR